MKFCSHCGAQIEDQAVVCIKCGCAVNANITESDVPSTVLNVISFLFPIIGLILFIVYHEKKLLKKAKAIGKWALIGFAVAIIPYSMILYELF